MSDFERGFGLVIAYLLPGFVALCGAACLSESISGWLVASGNAVPTVGGFLYVAVGSLTVGMTASAVRWVCLDTCHHRTGVTPPRWDFSNLQTKLDAFTYKVESHYRYYQFYGNTLVAMGFAYAAWRTSCSSGAGDAWPFDVGVLVLAAVFFAASRDALRKYYERASQVLGLRESGFEGEDHDERIGSRDARNQVESVDEINREKEEQGE